MRMLLLLGLLMLSACDKPAQPKAESAPAAAQPATPPEALVAVGKLDRSHAGQPASTASFQDPDGEAVSFAQFEGKPLLVNLWATWCPPCVAEMPTLDALARSRGKEIQVLALSQDRQDRDKVEAFFRAHRFAALEPYLDDEQAVMVGLGLDTLPVTILYDAKGREVWRMVGQEDWQGRRAAGLIAEAFARSR
jgi:thiol-disulfide isomerase/thioredoxin